MDTQGGLPSPLEMTPHSRVAPQVKDKLKEKLYDHLESAHLKLRRFKSA